MKYTDEELLQLIRDKAAELGRPPRKRELPQYSAVIYRFGSWSEGLRLAGFEKKKSPKRTLREKQEEKMNRTLGRLREMSAEDGFPTVVAWDMYARKHDLYSVSALKQKLSLTWDGIRKHLKLPQSRDRFTKDDCIRSLLQASEKLGEGFSKRQYEQWAKAHGYPRVSVITSRFNKTFNYAKEEVGLLTNEGKGLQFTNDDLQKALDRCYQELGDRFTEREYEQWRKSKHEILPNIETIRLRLGSVVETKLRLNQETYFPGNRYAEGSYKQVIYRFISDQLN